MIDLFLKLSEELTGEAPLNPTLARDYLKRVRAAAEGAHLDALLAEAGAIFEAGGDVQSAIAERIMGDDDLRRVAKVVILIWYFGEIRGAQDVGGHPDHYFQGLFWPIVSAHAPGISGGYFGHWSYPPDN